MEGFINFMRNQGVIGLAIAFVLGQAVTKIIYSLVNDIIQPILGFLVGSKFGLLSLHIGPIAIGSFLVSLINFTIIAAVVYFVFKKLDLGRLDKKNN